MFEAFGTSKILGQYTQRSGKVSSQAGDAHRLSSPLKSRSSGQSFLARTFESLREFHTIVHTANTS